MLLLLAVSVRVHINNFVIAFYIPAFRTPNPPSSSSSSLVRRSKFSSSMV
eukprot:EC848973.1.p3 GENE.EC848973.1~~EC848973.1.p3  ORF type:complete len:50 (-),score=9.08 EC848973.1:32-181(-)